MKALRIVIALMLALPISWVIAIEGMMFYTNTVRNGFYSAEVVGPLTMAIYGALCVALFYGLYTLLVTLSRQFVKLARQLQAMSAKTLIARIRPRTNRPGRWKSQQCARRWA